MTAPDLHRFPSSGGELAYTDVGEGEPVLLLHGFPLSSVTWRALTPALATRFRVIAPDLLGHGASARPAHAPLDLRSQAGYVRELLAHLGVGRVAIVGHAHGGGVAQLLALDGVDVGAMVLLNTVAFDEQPFGQQPSGGGPFAGVVGDTWPGGSTEVGTDRLRREDVEAGVRAVFLAGVADPDTVPDDVIDAYAGPWIAEGGPAAFARALHALDGEDLTGDEGTYAGWGFPILLLWGEEDPFLSTALAERLHDALPSSSFGLLPGVGHFVADEAGPTVVPMIAEWLRAKYLGAPHIHGDPHAGVVLLQLERRSALEDLAEYESEDPPVRYDPGEQEVGPNA